MPQLVLEKGAAYKKSLFRRMFSSNIFNYASSPYFLIVSMVGFVCLITLVTLVFSTNEVTKGYTLNKLDFEQQGLVKEREVKEMMLSKVRALDAIKSSPKVQKMIRPGVVAFVSESGNVVVKK